MINIKYESSSEALDPYILALFCVVLGIYIEVFLPIKVDFSAIYYLHIAVVEETIKVLSALAVARYYKFSLIKSLFITCVIFAGVEMLFFIANHKMGMVGSVILLRMVTSFPTHLLTAPLVGQYGASGFVIMVIFHFIYNLTLQHGMLLGTWVVAGVSLFPLGYFIWNYFLKED